MEEKKQLGNRVRFLTSVAYWAVILAIVYFIFKYFLNLVMPFFIALIFAALGRPIALWLSSPTRRKKSSDGSIMHINRKHPLNYNVAAILSVVIVILVILGVLALIAVPVVGRVVDLVSVIPSLYTDSIQPELESFLIRMETVGGEMEGPLGGLLEEAIPNILSSLGSVVTNVSGKILVWASSFASKLPHALLNGLICLIATVFIALDFDILLDFLKLNLQTRALNMTREIKDSLVAIVWEFLKSYFFIFLITTAEIFIGLLIIGIKTPLFYAVMIAIFDAFPIVGSGMILLPWSIITMIAYDFWKGFGLFILYLVVVIVREIIEPKIVGKRVGLRPILTLSTMVIGNRLFGGLGLFGLPIAAAIITDLNSAGILKLYKGVGEKRNEEAAGPAPEREPENESAEDIPSETAAEADVMDAGTSGTASVNQ